MEIRIGANLDADDLIEVLTNQLDHEDLLGFVKKLDMMVADWDFTDKLTEYFDSETAKKDEREATK